MTDRLPWWPLAVMFGAMPLLWLAGAFYLAWPLLGTLLAVLLLSRRDRVGLPAGTGWWLLFCALVLLSLSQLTNTNDVLVAVFRLSFYLTAMVVGLYAYAALREQQSWERIFRPLCLFWLGLVLLGWLGVLVPGFGATSPVEALLPGGLSTNPFLHDLVHLRAAEYSAQTPRPSAPFAYTNTWGSSWALLLPCVIAYLLSTRGGFLRPLLLISLPLSLPPAFLGLNRGMFVSLAAGLALLGLRGVARRQPRVVASVFAASVLVGATALIIPVGKLIAARTSSSDSTTDRLDLYGQALTLAGHSPLLGYGGPVRLDTTTAAAPVGTQGQLWQVLVSHGIPAVLIFVGWFVVVALRMGHAVTPAGQWLATVPVIGAVQLPFYGLTFHNLTVVGYVVGLGLAAVDGPVRRAVRSRTATRLPVAAP